jgi:probable F420-dependent oxidoreductase
MDVGLALPNLGRHQSAAAMVTLAQAAEELGFASVWTCEHIVVPPEMFDPFGNTLDSLTTLSYVAAATERLRLGTSVLILPLHEPVLLAKQAATVHTLCGGRLQLGVGVGWIAEEFALLSADFEGRGDVADEYLAVLRHLLAKDPAMAEVVPRGLLGVQFAPSVESPLPILVGGHAPSALRRAARMGDGWHGVWLEPEEVPRHVEATRGRSRRAGFSISLRVDFRIRGSDGGDGDGLGLIGDPREIVSKALRYRDAGVDELVIDFMDRDHGGVPTLEVILEHLRLFRAQVLPELV